MAMNTSFQADKEGQYWKEVALRSLKSVIYVILIGITFSSCVTHQELVNFNEGEGVAEGIFGELDIMPLHIQPDDILYVKISTLDENATRPFNISGNEMGQQNLMASNGVRPIVGHLVDYNGSIQFPILGKIKVSGMTTLELQEELEKRLSDYLVDPVVIVRFLNFRVTVLGEVNNPGTFLLAGERLTILDVIGQAGDLGPYANRSNILIVRDVGGERQMGRVDLHNTNIFSSPFYYLRQNDLIYVEPLSEKTASVRDQSQRILPWVSVITSLTTLFFAIFSLK